MKYGTEVINVKSFWKTLTFINFDSIKNGISDDETKQYQQADHDEIKKYPKHDQEQIMSSIFRNANRKDMNIKKRTVNEHFKNKKISFGHGKFLKKCVDDMYAECW